MLRDKDYVRTNDDLIFNVIGYEHPPGRAAANLKYVHGTKWTGGYQSAVDFLSNHHPQYVTDHISVPESSIAETYTSQAGLRQISSQSARNHLQQTAIDLAGACSKFFDVPLKQFGITDSLLWGPGATDSDIDLVVYGSAAASRVLAGLPTLFDQPEFEQHTAETFTRQTTVQNADVIRLVSRKLNKGLYRGVRFSLRAVREYNEIISCKPYKPVGPIELTARVEDHSQSLFFPATYQLDNGLDVVSFLMQYEGVFQSGDVLTVTGTLERGVRDRVVVGSLRGEGHRIVVDNATGNS